MNAVESKDSLVSWPDPQFSHLNLKASFWMSWWPCLMGKTEFKTEGSFVNAKGDVLDVIFTISVLPGHEENAIVSSCHGSRYYRYAKNGT